MKRSGMCLVALLLGGTDALAQVTQQWVARYNGLGDGVNFARTIALDGSGNVYVAGTSQRGDGYTDYATVAYDATGTQRWAARYQGPVNSFNEALAIAVDRAGNVYVTGYSESSAGDTSDYATVAYDATGTQRWVAQYNGAGLHGGAGAIAVDGSGNVYVTGSSQRETGAWDYTTVAYDATGAQRWVARYNGLGYGGDVAQAIAVDGSGNVYVTGFSDGDGTSNDYATVAYDANGMQLWVARYDGPAHGNDRANSIAVGGAGNVYVTGYSESSAGGTDYATVAYDVSGTQLWIARYSGPVNGLDGAQAIAVDGVGKVYVTGHSDGGTSSTDYATVAYDASGTQLWVARYNGPANGSDTAVAIAVDGSGNIYVTGNSYGGAMGDDYATVAYDTAGTERWVARYNGMMGLVGNVGDRGTAIAVDSSGNVYVTGYSGRREGGFAYATIKYSQP